MPKSVHDAILSAGERMFGAPSRPAPPMPECNPPKDADADHELICEIKALTAEVKAMREQMRRDSDRSSIRVSPIPMPKPGTRS